MIEEGIYEKKVRDFESKVSSAPTSEELISLIYNHMAVYDPESDAVTPAGVVAQEIYLADHDSNHDLSHIPKACGLRAKLSGIFKAEERQLAEESRFKLLGIHRAERIGVLLNILTEAQNNGEVPKNSKGEPESYEYIKKVINKLRRDTEAGKEPDFSYMTRSYGLRRKMEELLRLPMVAKQFLVFAKDNVGNDGRLDETTIYDKFYSVNNEPDKYGADHPLLNNPEYAIKISEIEKQLAAKGLDKSKDGWLIATFDKGPRTADQEGRLYLNLKPEKMIETFSQLIGRLEKCNFSATVKIPDTLTVDDLNRPDKCVVYFQAGNEREIVSIIESIHSDDRFENLGKPKFTAEINRPDESEMQGVAFGAEPRIIGGRSGKSFGLARSKALAETYAYAKKTGFNISPENSINFAILAKSFFVRNGVDPVNPAFNYLDGKFSVIRERSN